MSLEPRKKPVWVPPGGPGGVERPSSAIFEVLGEEGIFELLADVYRRFEGTPIRHLFPPDLLVASERSAAFFVQLLGGPPLFNERYGPPRMRARHIPFEIDERARSVWLDCFEGAVAASAAAGVFPRGEVAGFVAFLRGFSSWMVNVAPESDGT